jgi:SAM-dependent methyltransferase
VQPVAPDWDARFGGDSYFFGTEPNAFLVGCASLLPAGARILCVADGEGRNSVWLAQQGFAVDAFDGSTRGVEKARALAAVADVDVRYEQADVDAFAWPEAAYDAVAAIFVQFAPPDMRRRLYGGCARTLRPGGLLLLQGYRVEQLAYGTGGPRAPEHLYTEDQLRAELAAFHLRVLRSHDSELHEGEGHDGMSALVDVVGERLPDARGG